MSHTTNSQLGNSAIAAPVSASSSSYPPPAPELHHLKEDTPIPKTSDSDETTHDANSQLGASAIGGPVNLSSYPSPAPELHHLKQDIPDSKSSGGNESTDDAHSQLGTSAIAAPVNGGTYHPPPAPELHHLKEDGPISKTSDSGESTHDTESQLGALAIAAPINVGTCILPPAPELHHLKEDTPDSKTSVGGESKDDLTFHDLPPFPDNVPTAPLLRLSLKKLLERDPDEETNLWDACRNVGFFYLDLRAGSPSKRDSFHEDGDGELNGDGLLKDAEALFKLGEKVFTLPDEEKLEYDMKDKGSYFGYKGLGAGIIDSKGTRDRNEFYNTSKDDLLGISEPLPAPPVLRDEGNRALLKSYMQRSHAIVTLILGQLNTQLGLPAAKLQSLHRLRAVSGDQVRWVRAPPQKLDDKQEAEVRTLGEHTDFGSVTILFNRIGGLQILPPGGDEWCFVKPLKGHCVVNMGDAMVKFTSGILRSNIHRVVSPPGEQSGSTRMSLVYFARPEDKVLLKVLQGSEMIDEKWQQQGSPVEEEEITAKEWILRRAMGRRAGGDWAKGGGTEGDRLKQ